MSSETAVADILSSFTTATENALKGLPDAHLIHPPKNGITLLDAKNEIFLSYLQALALRNLNVIRTLKDGVDIQKTQALSDEITRKLIEHRVYLERGARPLEQKIKYQVDKVLKAAEEEERGAIRKEQAAQLAVAREANKQTSGSDDSDADSDASDVDDDGEIDELSYRPNPLAFAQAATSASSNKDPNAARMEKSKQDGVYRPPRISATLMPTTETKEKKTRDRPMRSTTVDEYINTELSTAPMAQPSIGSNITAGGRRSKDARQLAKEAERREYEETNLVRLPKESKKEMAKARARERGGFGGEEWQDLGNSLSRISEVTKRKGGRESALDKSRKRAAVEDGPRANGIGDAFDMKRRRMMKKMGSR